MKKLYRHLIRLNEKIGEKMLISRKKITEVLAILKKRNLYKNIKYSKEQKHQIFNFWKDNYGKKVSLRWGKLYQSINGVYCYNYISDYIFSTKIEPFLNPVKYSKFYSDKSITELLYSGVEKIKFPETLIVNCSGIYYNSKREVISRDYAIKILKEYDEFVIKPTIGGSSGFGVKLINIESKANNKKNGIISALLNDYKEDYIIQRKVISHNKLKNLYPYSVNTIRLITYIVNNEIFHAPICLRLGCDGSTVDNIHSGGIVVGVSDNGILSKWGYKLGYSDSKERHLFHPNTKIFFENYHVPYIDEMISIAKRLHTHTPHLNMISWDLALNESNEIILIEGNYYGQSIWFPQIVHGKSIFEENTSLILNKVNNKSNK